MKTASQTKAGEGHFKELLNHAAIPNVAFPPRNTSILGQIRTADGIPSTLLVLTKVDYTPPKTKVRLSGGEVCPSEFPPVFENDVCSPIPSWAALSIEFLVKRSSQFLVQLVPTPMCLTPFMSTVPFSREMQGLFEAGNYHAGAMSCRSCVCMHVLTVRTAALHHRSSQA